VAEVAEAVTEAGEAKAVAEAGEAKAVAEAGEAKAAGLVMVVEAAREVAPMVVLTFPT